MMIIAVMLGLIISFLCGAGVVYGVGRETNRQEETTPDEEKVHRQWVEFLNYDGEDSEIR